MLKRNELAAFNAAAEALQSNAIPATPATPAKTELEIAKEALTAAKEALKNVAHVLVNRSA